MGLGASAAPGWALLALRFLDPVVPRMEKTQAKSRALTPPATPLLQGQTSQGRYKFFKGDTVLSR